MQDIDKIKLKNITEEYIEKKLFNRSTIIIFLYRIKKGTI